MSFVTVRLLKALLRRNRLLLLATKLISQSFEAITLPLDELQTQGSRLIHGASAEISFGLKTWSGQTMQARGTTSVFPTLAIVLTAFAGERHQRASSGLGSLSRNADPRSPLTIRNMLLAYCSSKAALNMITIQLANELKNVGIKVNSANPGSTATDMNQHRGVRTVEQGAATPVCLALLPDGGPTGGVFNDDGPEPW